MSNLTVAPPNVDIGAFYLPPIVTSVSLAPVTQEVNSTIVRLAIRDNVTLSAAAQAIISTATNPGPDQSEALTQIDAGPVITFVPGDYTGAVLVGQNLQGAIFNQANLQDANFSGANLQRSQFIDTSVQGAQFTQADLRGADLTGARGLQSSQIYGAIFDTSTTFPGGIEDIFHRL